MIRVIRLKKNSIKIIVITIIIILIGTSVSANISTDLKNNNKVKDIYSFMRNIDNNDNLENIEQSNLYENFKKLVGNDSEIHFCGPAYIKSIGQGLHMQRNIKIVRLYIPILIPWPDWIGFERRIMNLWFIFCSYFYDENATTTITPLDKNETITLTGNHMVFCSVFLFPHPNNFREKINEKLENIFNITIDFPLFKIHGKNCFNWSFPVHWLLNLANLILNPFKMKLILYGFFKSLEFYGYTPFVIWTNSSIIK